MTPHSAVRSGNSARDTGPTASSSPSDAKRSNARAPGPLEAVVVEVAKGPLDVLGAVLALGAAVVKDLARVVAVERVVIGMGHVVPSSWVGG